MQTAASTLDFHTASTVLLALQARAGNLAVEGLLAQRRPVPAAGVHAKRSFQVLSRDQAERQERAFNAVKAQVDALEHSRDVTTEEAENYRAALDKMVQRTQGLATRQLVTAEERRDLVEKERHLRDQLKAWQAMPGRLHGRAELGRGAAGHPLIANFQVTPPVIRVGEHEASRISFEIRGKPASVAAIILSKEEGEGTAWRQFLMEAKNGHHDATWDGTFEGARNQPPQTGTYRIRVMVTDAHGRQDQVWEQIRVENPANETVLPRTGSGLRLTELTFDGSQAVLKDEGGHSITMHAISGMRANNPHNSEHKDWTGPQHQWVKDRGPLPEGDYSIMRHAVQHPELRGKRLRYPSGGTAHAWGPIRAPLSPGHVGNRDQFFLHLDVTADGTAGCIGIQPEDEGKFNQMMSVIALMESDSLPVTVRYPASP